MIDLLLRGVRVPPQLQGPTWAAFGQDAVNLHIKNGHFAGVQYTFDAAKIEAKTVVEAHDQLLLSGLVDAHTHIDKTYVLDRCEPARGDLMRAIGLMASCRDAFTVEDVRARMSRALAAALAAGTRALRTHIDWVTRTAPLASHVWEEMRDAWRGRMVLQAVSLTPLDLFADAREGHELAREVAALHKRCNHALGEQVALGAFVYRNADLRAKLERVFDLAEQHGLSLDFHVDEGLHGDAQGLHVIAQIALERRFAHGIVCGHACSLGVQSPELARSTLALCAQAGIHLVALPTTNLYLQGAWDATPLERGITRVHEARAAGVGVSLATDNVEDAFFPYGSYDLLDVFSLGVQVAHLGDEAVWLDALTTAPARALRLPWDGVIEPGCPADFVLLDVPDARSLVARGGRVARRVFRQGVEI
jgi:cytosine/creatinine deaminase